MRRQAWIVLAVMVVVLAAAGAAWVAKPPGAVVAGDAQAAGSSAAKAGKPGDAASAPPLEFRASELVQPQRASLPERIAFSGPLVAPNTALLRARLPGTLVALAVAEGDRVKAGQVLGRIDMAELAPRIAERSAMLDSARASLAQAERTHASNERLAAQNFISPSALDSTRAQVDTARAALAAAQATLETTRVGQRDATLVAPIAGIVARRHVLPGEKLSAEQQVLTIVDLARLELAATVGTHEVARLAPGMPVAVRVEGLDAPIAGRLARIAPAAEAGTRSIGVTVALTNAQERLRAGQYAVGEVLLPDDRQRLLLPATAVGSTAGQSHVWVIEGGRLARRAVTLGRRDEAGGRVEVLDGIGVDARVLAARYDNLREGALALVIGSAPPGAAGLPTVAGAATTAASAPALR
ncbi:MAG: efflux RND transporter periplasmic adaptor subunit [Aquabacterium sp.]|nr:efflux RND transporter periplasmic adaptor subunit [Aquabacterium sp.]